MAQLQTQGINTPKLNLFTPKINLGLPVSQANVTNFSDFKKSITQQTQPTKQSGFSLIPTANAMEEEKDLIQSFLDDNNVNIENRKTVFEMLKDNVPRNIIEDAIINKAGYKGQTQTIQEPQVTEQSFGEMGLNIAGNIYEGVENLGADAINIGSSAIGSDFRVKPLREQLFDTGEEYKGGLSQNIANKIYKRGEKMANISENSINQTQGETSFQFGANLGAGVTDTIGEVFFSGLSTLTPDSQKEKLNNYIGEIAKTKGGEMAINKAKELKAKYQEFKFNNPRAGRNTDAVLDTLNFITNSGVIKFGDEAINTGINKAINTFDKGVSKVGEGINTLKTEVKEGLDRGFSIPGKGKTVLDNTIQNATKAKTKGGVEFDIEDKPGFTTKIFDKVLSKDNEILAQQAVMPKATKEKTLKGRSQSSKTALEGIEQLYEDKAKGIIQEDIKLMPGGVNGMDEGLSYYGKKIGELTDNKAIIDTMDLVNNLEKSLNEPFSGINSSMKSVVTNIIDEFKKINYQASIGDLQNALSNIKSEIFSNAENITKLYKTNTGKALNNFLNEIDIRFNKTIENTTGNLPELLEAKKAYSKYKKIQKDFTDSLMVDIRNQGKGLTGTAGKIAGLYEVLNNPSMSGIFKAVVLKNVAEKMQYYKTRSGNYETLIRKLDKEALERFKNNNIENDINNIKSNSSITDNKQPLIQKPLLQLQPGKKEAIITPQTLDNAVIQQSKADLQKAKIDTTNPQPKVFKKSPLSDREKALLKQNTTETPAPNPNPAVSKPKLIVKKPLKTEPTTVEKVTSDTTQVKENKPILKKENVNKVKEVFKKKIENLENEKIFTEKDIDYIDSLRYKPSRYAREENTFNIKNYIIEKEEKGFKIYKDYNLLGKAKDKKEVLDLINGKKQPKPLLKIENLEKVKEMFKKETPTKKLLSKEKIEDNGLVKKDIEGYTQSLINKRGEYLEISKRYQNILKEIENEKNPIKLKELKKQEKIIGKELNDFADNSNYKSYENKTNIDEIASKITTDTTKLAKEKIDDNGLVKKENYDEVKKSIPAGVFNRSQSEIFKIAKEKGLLDYKKIGTDYFYYDVENGWKQLNHNGHKFKQNNFIPTERINALEDQLKELEGGLNDKGAYNTRENYNKIKEELDFFKKYEYNIYHNLDKDLGYHINRIMRDKDSKYKLDVENEFFEEKLVRDYKITNQTHIAKVKETIQKYIKEYGEDIKNYLSLLADDIVDIVGGRAKLLGGENAKLFDKNRWEQAKEMTRAGKSTDEIWKETGWEKGTDGKWKFEIDDSIASLKKGFDKDKYGDYINVNDFSKPLKDILEHKELFIQYPNLKKVEVRLSKNLDEMGGASFDFKNNIIYLDDRLSNKDKLKYLIHEIQHGIQKKEGNKFDYGNREIDKTDYEVEARNSETRLNKTPAERKLLRPEKTEDVERSKQIVKMEGGKAMSMGDDLISEAKKYKTFEEFKKSQGEELYHGTNSVNIEGINKKGFISGTEKPTRINGIWFSYNKNTAKNYGDTIITSFGKTKNTINTNSKEFEKISKLKGSLTENILNKGYDAVIDGENIAIINPKNIKTEAQLKTIYEQATKPKLLKPKVSDDLIKIEETGTFEDNFVKGKVFDISPESKSNILDLEIKADNGEINQKQIDSLNKWLKDNKNNYIKLYHGTSPQWNILGEGLKKTKNTTKRSLQSEPGYVYLSFDPDRAKTFGEMGYAGKIPKVYEVKVRIGDLKVDTDQLKNQIYWGENENIGDTLADSLLYGKGFRVKGDIAPYKIIEYKKAN